MAEDLFGVPVAEEEQLFVYPYHKNSHFSVSPYHKLLNRMQKRRRNKYFF